MASALEKLMKGTLQKSDSQKAFSPWWESFEDKLLYSLMILGMITLPFNMVSNTPVECTLDQNHPSFQNLSAMDRNPMRYHHFYLRKYCTMNFIHDAMIFLPFILILAPLPLVGVGRMCLQYFRVQKRMDSFYKLLVKDSLDREDVEAMEKEKMRNSHEVQQMFQDSNGIHHSYVAKSCIQVILGAAISGLLLWVHLFGLSGEDIKCSVFGQHYVCVVPLATFYSKIVFVANVAITGYVGCSLFTLLWVIFPRLSPFYRFMQLSKEHVDYCISLEYCDKVPKNFMRSAPLVENAEPFFDMFFDPKSRDLGLLITLLACRNGVAEGLRFVSMFDKEYKMLWRPLDVSVYHDHKSEQKVHVEWDDAPLAAFCNAFRGRISRLRVEYTLEIVPPSSEAPLKSHKFRKFSQDFEDDESAKESPKRLKYRDCFLGVDVDNRPSPPPPLSSGRRPQLQHQPCSVRTLYGSDYFGTNAAAATAEKRDCRIIISCEVNGRTIAQRTEKVPPTPILPECFFKMREVPEVLRENDDGFLPG